MSIYFYMYLCGEKMLNFKSYLKTREASQFLGITPETLRTWTKEKRVTVYKSSVNEHRLYKKEDLQKVLDSILPVE